ncbi:MAG: hypothetical protein R3C05_24235 [Pirellulaceae bacterium]
MQAVYIDRPLRYRSQQAFKEGGEHPVFGFSRCPSRIKRFDVIAILKREIRFLDR